MDEELQDKTITKEIIEVLLQASKYGKKTGGMTTEQITELCNRLRKIQSGIIQAERTKANEEAIKTIKKAFVDYHGYDFKKSIGLDGEDYQARIVCEDAINELKQSLAEKKGGDTNG